MASDNFFEIFGVSPLLGRTFDKGEEDAGRNYVAVVSNETWQTMFGSRPSTIGEKIKLNGRPYTVIGVMPPGFRFPISQRDAIYIPLDMAPCIGKAAAITGCRPSQGSRRESRAKRHRAATTRFSSSSAKPGDQESSCRAGRSGHLHGRQQGGSAAAAGLRRSHSDCDGLRECRRRAAGPRNQPRA